MINFNLLQDNEISFRFEYPQSFHRTLQLNLVKLEPWYIVEGDELRRTFRGLGERYSTRRLVPFARRQDNDDIACWEHGSGERVFVVHDFASPGWEQRHQFENFWAWFRKAIEDMINFDE